MSALERLRASLQRLDAFEDADLGHYFLRTATIEGLAKMDDGRVLGVGLKGIGKSAAYRFLVDLDSSCPVRVGIHSSRHSVYLRAGELNYAACRKQFEHDLVFEALRAISICAALPRSIQHEAGKHFKRYSKLLKEARARFGGISIVGFGFTVHQGDARTLVGLATDPGFENAKESLASICAGGISVRLVIDDPELIFSETQDLDVHLLGGLLLAAASLSRMAGFKIILLVKSHVFRPLATRFEELDKIPHSTAHLAWSRDDLVAMIGQRLAWSDLGWGDLFSDLDADGGRSEVMAMCDRLRSGPRELIFWLEEALGASAPAPLTRAVVASTRRSAATYSLASLARSHSQLYPGIEAVVHQIFAQQPSRMFERRELVKWIGDLKSKHEEIRSLWRMPWLQTEAPSTLPEILFRAGALVIEHEGRRILPYEADYLPERFQAADRFGLVPALRDAF